MCKIYVYSVAEQRRKVSVTSWATAVTDFPRASAGNGGDTKDPTMRNKPSIGTNVHDMKKETKQDNGHMLTSSVVSPAASSDASRTSSPPGESDDCPPPLDNLLAALAVPWEDVPRAALTVGEVSEVGEVLVLSVCSTTGEFPPPVAAGSGGAAALGSVSGPSSSLVGSWRADEVDADSG